MDVVVPPSPVEEIIGWTLRELEDRSTSWHLPTCQRDGRPCRCGWGPTVDDLAAWLDEHRPNWKLIQQFTLRLWATQRTGFKRGRENIEWYPTIRDALIAAVRKVAEND